MTDAEVITEVDAARHERQRAEARAQHARMVADKKIWEHLGRAQDDVGRAARGCALRRAEAACEVALRAAYAVWAGKMEALRARAGEWYDLVPRPRG